MHSLLIDLARHQSWADSEYWAALETCPAAMADDAIRKRLHHLHIVQQSFLWMAEGRNPADFPMTSADNFRTVGSLREFAEKQSRAIAIFLDRTTDARLGEHIRLPWFPADPPFSITVAEALTQAMMHSQWHRGQNATRLRELGGEPPMIDLIIWYWKGRPAARWS